MLTLLRLIYLPKHGAILCIKPVIYTRYSFFLISLPRCTHTFFFPRTKQHHDETSSSYYPRPMQRCFLWELRLTSAFPCPARLGSVGSACARPAQHQQAAFLYSRRPCHPSQARPRRHWASARRQRQRPRETRRPPRQTCVCPRAPWGLRRRTRHRRWARIAGLRRARAPGGGGTWGPPWCCRRG